MRSMGIAAATLAAMAAASGIAVTTSETVHRPARTGMSDVNLPSFKGDTNGTPQRATRAERSEFATRRAWARVRNSRERRAGPGWTNAHARRVAMKKRRVRANKARR